MRKNIYLLLLISVVISLFFLPSAFAEENNAKTNFNIEENLEYNISLEENQIEEDYIGMSDFYKYQDVFYPPEEELARQGMTIESYKQALKRNASKSRNLYSSVDNIWGTCPTTGTIHIPVLLAQFPNKPPMYTLEQIDHFFNSPDIEPNFISVSKYYNMQSYGALNLVFDVYNWTIMPQPFSYYSADINEFQLVIDAVNTFNPSVDFTQYDSNNDGRLDGIVIIYSDYGRLNSSGILPQTRILKQYNLNQVDGKYLGNAALVSERKSSVFDYFANVIATHEFAHVLGLMDLYPTYSITGAIYQMSMMNFKESVPPTPTAIDYCLNKPINLDVWSRYFLGWINPEILTIDSNKNIILRSVNDYNDAAILRNNNFGTREFFIIENRYRSLTDPNNLDKCMFDNSDYNTGGFAIYHVDEQYIENNYPTNSIMYDSDNNYCGGNSHPGIVYEQNYVTSCSTSITVERTDLYFNDTINGCNQFYRFDETPHGCTGTLLDLISNSYIGVDNTLVRFQALSPASQYTMTAKMLVGEETISPIIETPEGTYLEESVSIIISTSEPNTIIHYTIDGTDPTTTSAVYDDPIILPVGTVTLKAMAKGEDYYASEVVSRTYTIIGTVANPQATPESGVVDYNSTVILSTSTEDAEIRYTTDFTTPIETSPLYSSPINITQDINLNIRAFKTGYIPSETINYYYSVAPVATPVASHPGGEILFRTPVTLSTTTPQATIRYTTNGTEPTATSPRYTYPIYIVQPTTLKAKTFRDGQQPSETITYNYQVKLLTPRVNIESGIYPFTTKIKLTSDVPGTQIYYTTDGTDPNDGQLYTTHFRLLEDMHLRAIVKRTGYIDSEILNKTYTVSNQEQSVPKLLIDPRTPRGYESFDLIYITERHWADDVNFTITNLNSCTFNLRPIIYNDGHYTYYVFENNRCIRRIQTRLTLTVRDQNYQERADAELIVLDPGLQAIAVGMH